MERQSSPARSAVVLVVVLVGTLGVCWLALLTIHGRIPRNIAVGVLALLLVALFSVPALVLVRVGLVYAMDRRIDAGDYDGTIRLADRFQGWWPRWAGSYMQKSSALIYAGRFAEAEALLVEANGKKLKDEAATTLMRSFLGSVFLEQGRYQEARATFRGATIGDPQSGFPKGGRSVSADLGLAEVEIRSRGDMEAALNYAREGIRTGGQLYRKFEPDGYARALAIRAWAAGRLNRWGDASELIEQAASSVRGKSKPVGASACFYLGLTETDHGAPAAARAHFERGAGFDPHGFWGMRCSEALQGNLPDWAAIAR